MSPKCWRPYAFAGNSHTVYLMNYCATNMRHEHKQYVSCSLRRLVVWSNAHIPAARTQAHTKPLPTRFHWCSFSSNAIQHRPWIARVCGERAACTCMWERERERKGEHAEAQPHRSHTAHTTCVCRQWAEPSMAMMKSGGVVHVGLAMAMPSIVCEI